MVLSRQEKVLDLGDDFDGDGRLREESLREDPVILRSYERGMVSHRQLPGVIKEWREPSFEEFQPRSLWSLLNAFTTALSGVRAANPQRFCALTMGLQAFLGEAARVPAAEPAYATPA
jgi:hypothetical protein